MLCTGPRAVRSRWSYRAHSCVCLKPDAAQSSLALDAFFFFLLAQGFAEAWGSSLGKGPGLEKLCQRREKKRQLGLWLQTGTAEICSSDSSTLSCVGFPASDHEFLLQLSLRSHVQQQAELGCSCTCAAHCHVPLSAEGLVPT